MASGPEHYMEAERLAASVREYPRTHGKDVDDRNDALWITSQLRLAAVHAQLAAVAVLVDKSIPTQGIWRDATRASTR